VASLHRLVVASLGGTSLTWIIRVMLALGRKLVTSHQGGDVGSPISVNLDSHGFVVTRLKINEKIGCKLFNGIAFGRPHIIVWFEMETKVGAKTSWDGGA
jgi:hypothetical protein